MSAFRSQSIFVPLLAGLGLLAACATVKTNFKEAQTYGAFFYSNILHDTCGNISVKNSMPDAIRGVTVYKTSFREKYVEAGDVLTPTSLNDSSKRKGVSYKYLIGYLQDLYLIRVKAKCNEDVWVYFSVWYRPRTDMPVREQYGFGKAYLGIQDTVDKTIHFTQELKMENDQRGYFLSYKGNVQFYFVLDNLERGKEPVRVNRIVTEEDNKFGGPDAFVFKVADHFRGELSTLNFRKLASLSIQ